VATAPASFVAARVQDASRGSIAFQDVSGTAWNGRARATLALPASSVQLDEVRWRFRPASLASGRFAFDVQAGASGLGLAGELGRSVALWEARDIRVEGPANALTAVVPLLAAWRPEGALSAQAAALSWNDREMRGEARIEWRGAAIGLSQVRPLGSYRADVRGEGATAKIAVTTAEGALRITGQGSISAPMRVAFTGEARAEGPSATALRPLLDLMGPRRPDGAHELRWRLD
jgi:general secretion pathway protein N